MKKISFIYKNIYIYRLTMYILYKMKYKQRFIDIINLITPNEKNIVELCFGDIYIAQYFIKDNKKWLGIDINENFVNFAKKHKLDVLKQDVLIVDLPKSDVCIMVGSLYHFADDIELILSKMLKSANRVIISEPIVNISNNNNYIGFLAKRLTNAGKGSETFRFNRDSFINMLNLYQEKLSFQYKIIKESRDILVILDHK